MFGIQHGTRARKRADVIGNNRLLIVIGTQSKRSSRLKRLLYESSCESRARQLSSNETRWSQIGRRWKSMQTKRKELMSHGYLRCEARVYRWTFIVVLRTPRVNEQCNRDGEQMQRSADNFLNVCQKRRGVPRCANYFVNLQIVVRQRIRKREW